MTTTETTPSEPIGTKHIRVWWTGHVLVWYSYEGEFQIESFLEYVRDVICVGLKEEDFDLQYLETGFMKDVYLRRFENAF